jgi:hypothetical protein
VGEGWSRSAAASERRVRRDRVERFGMLGVFLVDRIGEGGGRLP